MSSSSQMNDVEWAEERQRITDFMSYYREAKAHLWEPARRQKYWRAKKLPKVGAWPGHRWVNNDLVNANPHPVDFRRIENMPHDWKGSSRTAKLADDAVKKVTPEIEPYGLTFKKLLAWGGLGVAAVFELQDKNGNARRQVVVKADLHAGYPLIHKEKSFFAHLLRARHIAQMVRIRFNKTQVAGSKRKTEQTDAMEEDDKSSPNKRRRLLAGKREPPAPRKLLKLSPSSKKGKEKTDSSSPSSDASGGGASLQTRVFKVPESTPDSSPHTTPHGSKDLSTRQDVLVLELVSRGNLYKWMCKMGSEKKDFSDKVLWRFFECLFKGVVAMAYPPRLYPNFEETGGEGGPMEDERLPKEKDKLGPTLAHFDLDPSNILVGNFNVAGAHGMTPILKITDFGLSRWTDDIKRDKVRMWRSRKMGKYNNGYLAPEQFHEEWDWVNLYPDAEKPKPRIAGNYSWKTNLYHIGLIMWSLITHCNPPRAPYPNEVSTTTVDSAGKKETKWTYGAALLADTFAHVDADLRVMVVNAMMEDPADRPGFEDVARIIREKIDGAWPGESDEDTRRWAREFFETPGVPGPEEPSAVEVRFEQVVASLQKAWI